MKAVSNTYQFKHKVSGFVMMIALLWLTVSLPFVYSFQQEAKQMAKQISSTEKTSDDDSSNPLSNTNEEKTESGANTLSEYLHDLHIIEHHFTILTSFYKCHPSDLYFAFHPELISPPPDQA